MSTARALRAQGYTGEVVVVGNEIHRPYDRPPLSKDFLGANHAQVELSLEGEAEDLDVTWHLGVHATALRPIPAGANGASSDDATVEADAVVVATGAAARCDLPGVGLPGVHLLRTIDDAVALRADLHKAVETGQTVAIVGGGFIGSEVAATARQLGCQVTVFVPDDVPLRGALGPYADAVAALHAANGVTVRPYSQVLGVRQSDTDGLEVLLDGIDPVPAATVVLGIGAAPAVGWLVDSGLELNGGVGNAVRCDASGATNLPGVYAVGDCAAWFDAHRGRHHQIEHWTSAKERGAVVAARLLGAREAADLPAAVRLVRHLRQTPPVGRLPRPGRPSGHPRAHPADRLARRGQLHRRLPAWRRTRRCARPRPVPRIQPNPPSPRRPGPCRRPAAVQGESA